MMDSVSRGTSRLGRNDFWQKLDQLVAEHELIIDRPRGSRHPRYPNCIYPLDYGYLEGTQAADGSGIDVWVGSLPERAVTAVVCAVDMAKRDVEIKILLDCTAKDAQTVLDWHNDEAGSQAALLVKRVEEAKNVL